MLTALRGILIGALIVLANIASPPVSAQDRDYDIDVFHEALAPYGDWSEHPRWGSVWRPRVAGDWRPYSRGHWVFTEEHGWYWVAEEPWGWAPFHYGRWVFDEDDGWVWLPGSEWGPAWVAWRYSDEYVGWAPLGPDATWGPDGALIYDDRHYDDARFAGAWSFVQPHYMTTPGLYRFLAPAPRSAFFLRRTRPVHGYRRHDRRVVNTGFDVRRYERLVGRPVQIMRLRAVDNPREHGFRRGPGADIPVFRPRIIDRPDGARHRPPNVAIPDRRSPDAGGGPAFTRRMPDQPYQPGPPGMHKANPPQGYDPQRAPVVRQGTPPPGAGGGGPPGYNPPRAPYARQGPPGEGPPPAARSLPSPGGPPPAARSSPSPGGPGAPQAGKPPPKKEERRGQGQGETR